MLLLHHFFRYSTASLFLAPLGISFLLATISPAPVITIAIAALACELLSTLIFGSMIVVFSIPFFVQWLMKNPEVGITWKFFFTTFLCVTLQIIAIIIAKTGLHAPALQSIPFGIIGIQLACTSIITYVITVAFHEYTSRL
ncbi:MAG: hypothetical protein K8Q97_04580 [Candidatus Andersenbacteria bacterium]|nr:hypothetical protein [Candidatus Andersenbacteria bacterium]